MKFYRCDICEKDIIKPEVQLNGIAENSDDDVQFIGMIFPSLEKFYEKHFCGPECFWVWCDKNRPDSSQSKDVQS